MNTQELVVGSRIAHPFHGEGTVTFVGTDYLGIDFDGSGEALIRSDTLENDEPIIPVAAESSLEALPWPESTFVPDKADTQHYLGSHLDPFVEESADLLKRLPEMLPNALVQTGYGDVRKPPRSVPEDWPQGFQLVWPLRTQGLAMILRVEKEENMIVSLFPFIASGSQQTLTLREVAVWEGGLEAQITAAWHEAEVTFFDTQFVVNRAWYDTGKDYEFTLAGLAYSAQPAEKREWTINRHPDEVAWMNRNLKGSDEPYEPTYTLSMDGAAMFMAVEGWDVDDYSFHAPVKSVEEFKDWLGQDGWRVRATVMRFGDEDADLDILITRRAWSGEAPPRVGEDIEGRLWLQGYLWMPPKGKE